MGASGVLVYTGSLDASSVMSEAHATSSANASQGYRGRKLDLAKKRGRMAAPEEALQKAGLDQVSILHRLDPTKQEGSGSSDSNGDTGTKRKPP